MSDKIKFQDDTEVYGYMFHNPMTNRDGEVVLSKNGSAVVFGSPIYRGGAPLPEAVQADINTITGELADHPEAKRIESALILQAINRMVEAQEATVFVNGVVTVWRVKTGQKASRGNKAM